MVGSQRHLARGSSFMMARGREHNKGSPQMEVTGERFGARGAPTAGAAAEGAAAAAWVWDKWIDDQ